MKDPREQIRSLINSLTADREFIDRAIEALRQLDPPQTADDLESRLIVSREVKNELPAEQRENGNGAVAHTNGNANGHANGHANETPEMSESVAQVVKTLQKLSEPVRASVVHRAMGKKAPANSTDIFRLLNKAVDLKCAIRSGNKGAYLYAAATSLQ
jgi:hypothetical protein